MLPTPPRPTERAYKRDGVSGCLGLRLNRGERERERDSPCRRRWQAHGHERAKSSQRRSEARCLTRHECYLRRLSRWISKARRTPQSSVVDDELLKEGYNVQMCRGHGRRIALSQCLRRRRRTWWWWWWRRMKRERERGKVPQGVNPD
jgi:hypothetical protein